MAVCQLIHKNVRSGKHIFNIYILFVFLYQLNTLKKNLVHIYMNYVSTDKELETVRDHVHY